MPILRSITPAMFWRAFFVLSLATGPSFGAAPAGPRPELAQVGKPDASEAARLVEQFRNSGLPGQYFLEFQLRQMPRRGSIGPTYAGRWWGSRNEEGAVLRIELTEPTGTTHRLLLQNGAQARVWRLENGLPVEVGVDGMMAPLVPGIEISAFDLQMPYLYWPGASVEKITRVLGRPAYAFVFPAPAAFKAQFAGIGAARAYLDTQFNVPMQTEVLGPEGQIVKSLALLSLQTVQKQTLPKTADYRNEVTRDKTRLQVIAVALDLDLPAALFRPANLTQPGSVPEAGRVVRMDP
jgi:hypothetical protein